MLFDSEPLDLSIKSTQAGVTNNALGGHLWSRNHFSMPLLHDANTISMENSSTAAEEAVDLTLHRRSSSNSAQEIDVKTIQPFKYSETILKTEQKEVAIFSGEDAQWCQESVSDRSEGSSSSSTADVMDSPMAVAFPSMELTASNYSNSGALDCKQCHERFTSFEKFCEHLMNHSRRFVCMMCGKAYKQVRAYRAHLLTHQTASKFTCDICNEVLTSTTDYLQHLKLHGRKELQHCKYCNRYFRDTCTLQTHMWTHTGDKPYKCDKCGKSFRQTGTLRRHAKSH